MILVQGFSTLAVLFRHLGTFKNILLFRSHPRSVKSKLPRKGRVPGRGVFRKLPR